MKKVKLTTEEAFLKEFNEGFGESTDRPHCSSLNQVFKYITELEEQIEEDSKCMEAAIELLS